MKALIFSTFGNSDVLEYTDIPTPILKEADILVEMHVIRLNFTDFF
ncbi:hypothetical protein [Flavobacterium sp. ZT3R25]